MFLIELFLIIKKFFFVSLYVVLGMASYYYAGLQSDTMSPQEDFCALKYCKNKIILYRGMYNLD